MEENQKKLAELTQILGKIFVLESETKKKLIHNFLSFSEKKQNHLLFVLKKSLERQNQFVEKALEKNPDLIKDIKKGVGEKMKEIRKEEEQKNNTEELEILKKLEEDILQA